MLRKSFTREQIVAKLCLIEVALAIDASRRWRRSAASRLAAPTRYSASDVATGRLWFNSGACTWFPQEYPNHVWSYDFAHHTRQPQPAAADTCRRVLGRCQPIKVQGTLEQYGHPRGS